MIVLELAESFLPRECSGAERDGWGDDRGLAAKRRKGRKNRIDDGKADAGGRRAEGWPTEHTEHTEGFLTGGNGVIGGRRAEDGGVTADDGLLTLELRRAGTGLRVTT